MGSYSVSAAPPFPFKMCEIQPLRNGNFWAQRVFRSARRHSGNEWVRPSTPQVVCGQSPHLLLGASLPKCRANCDFLDVTNVSHRRNTSRERARYSRGARRDRALPESQSTETTVINKGYGADDELKHTAIFKKPDSPKALSRQRMERV